MYLEYINSSKIKLKTASYSAQLETVLTNHDTCIKKQMNGIRFHFTHITRESTNRAVLIFNGALNLTVRGRNEFAARNNAARRNTSGPGPINLAGSCCGTDKQISFLPSANLN